MPKNLLVLTPHDYTSEFCQDILNDELILSTIADYTRSKHPVQFLPWGATKSVYLLQNELQRRGVAFTSQELPTRDHYWTSLYIDSKVGFRELCTKLKQLDSRIQIPMGFTCGSFSEAMEVLNWFYSQRIPCVVKASSGVGGFGNIFLNENDFEKTFEDVTASVNDAVQELPYFTSGTTIVEEMIVTNLSSVLTSQICSSSLFMSGVILPDGEVELVGGGVDIRNAMGYYAGAEVGKETDLDSATNVLEPVMYRIGEAISEYGYRGQWGINFMISKNGTPIAIELNARRCGESHVYAMAKRLYGQEWMKICYAITRLTYSVKVHQEVSISSVLDAFEKTNVVYKKDGVLAVPTQVSWLYRQHPGIGYVLFGTNKARVKLAEDYLHDQLSAQGIQSNEGDNK